MNLPADLKALANTIIVCDADTEVGDEAINASGKFGILFDWSTFKGQQTAELLDHFGDCEPDDFSDLRDGEDFKAEWMPFVMWEADSADLELEDRVAAQQAKPGTKTVAYSKDGDYPQFNSMWFLHSSGRVAVIETDGTFVPAAKATPLADNYKELQIRAATTDDLDRDDEDDDDDDDEEGDDEGDSGGEDE